MPRGDPFTALCQQSARMVQPIVADLHLHTTASDGEFTPQQVLAFAAQQRLQAISITDHDTLTGYTEVAQLATRCRVISGVEVTTMFHGQEVHVLGYGFDPHDIDLQTMLEKLRGERRARFLELLELLAQSGVRFTPGLVENLMNRLPSLGRRHLAMLMIRSGFARSRFEAFHRYLNPLRERTKTPLGIPIEMALNVIRKAGGVSALAHPRNDCDESVLSELTQLGLQAIEVYYPAAKPAQIVRLKQFAQRNNLLQTGGSDCHGHGSGQSPVGTLGITCNELTTLMNRFTSSSLPEKQNHQRENEENHTAQNAG